jgi:hypothetical protein
MDRVSIEQVARVLNEAAGRPQDLADIAELEKINQKDPNA